MNKVQIIESKERPEGMSEADELAWALARVLRWPNPNGTIADYYLPGWLSEHAKSALRRYLRAD